MSYRKKNERVIGAYGATLQPKNDWPRLGRILDSVWTSIKPPKHMSFCKFNFNNNKKKLI